MVSSKDDDGCASLSGLFVARKWQVRRRKLDIGTYLVGLRALHWNPPPVFAPAPELSSHHPQHLKEVPLEVGKFHVRPDWDLHRR